MSTTGHEPDEHRLPFSFNRFWCDHQWEIIFGILFAILAAVGWELLKLPLEEATHVSPDRLASGTVRVLIGAPIRSEAARAAVEEWRKSNYARVSHEFAVLNSGSAFVVSDDGFVLTAAHLVNTQPLAGLLGKMGTGSTLDVFFPVEGDRQVHVVWRDEDHDVAVLKADNAPRGRFLVLGNGHDVRMLDRVHVIGYPASADAFGPLEPTMSSGEISKVVSAYGGTRFQTTASINRGNSGGPLLNDNGRVIGMNVSVPAERSSGDAEAIAYARAIDFAKELLEKKHVRLESHYEHEGLLRQRWLGWLLAGGVSIALLVYLFVLIRPHWVRWFAKNAHEPPYAGFWIRATALLVDATIVAAFVLAITLLLIFITNRFMPTYELLIGVVPVWVLYQAYCIWRWGGGIGKRLAGVRVERFGERALTFGDALRRSLAALLSAIPLFVGFVMAGFRRNRQALHDTIAGTVVVNERVRSTWQLAGLGALSCAVLFIALVAHLRLLTDRALDDLNGSYLKLTSSTGARGASAVHLLAMREDRIEWLRLFPTLHDRVQEELYSQGLAYMFSGDPRKAIEAFQASGNVYALTRIGWCYLDLGDAGAAKRTFEAALRRDKQSPDAMLGAAVAALRLGDVNGAREKYTQAARLDDDLATNPAGRAATHHYTPGQVQAINGLRAVVQMPAPPSG